MFKFLSSKLKSLFKGTVDEEFLENAERLFYESDFGAELTEKLLKTVQRSGETSKLPKHLKDVLSKVVWDVPPSTAHEINNNFPTKVFLIVGSNGTGKTTSVAKLASYFQRQGKKVLVVATDTFRAAGIDQLKLWADRMHCGFVSGQPGGDPASVAFDGLQSAKAKDYDIVIVDTSGRLHTNQPLMHELDKITQVCNKAIPNAPHEILITVDATAGGNAVEQVGAFLQSLPLTGFILTKTDSSAKGGTLFRIYQSLRLPAAFFGSGENIESLHPFDLDLFLDSFFQDLL
ncbi:signal recognition particle-docking protein FtsY [Chlamydiifrater phoenicopteri]|uniref:signal recognition particle-docking protein FtsY n=1 Tax=Chlamydiifrater phoenicopteri TaxID=2681469 RepID=UPI001BCCC749|nr:signal recognition particle-docking protein FtsY [Chlamydiifrater phoenicopteri]